LKIIDLKKLCHTFLNTHEKGLETSVKCVHLPLIFTKTTHYHSWAKEISNQSAAKFAGAPMAKAAPTHAKCGLLRKRQLLNAPKALLGRVYYGQGFSFSLPHEAPLPSCKNAKLL